MCPGPRYTDADRDFLEEVYSDADLAALAERLGRSVSALRTHASTRGLKRRRKRASSMTPRDRALFRLLRKLGPAGEAIIHRAAELVRDGEWPLTAN